MKTARGEQADGREPDGQQTSGNKQTEGLSGHGKILPALEEYMKKNGIYFKKQNTVTDNKGKADEPGRRKGIVTAFVFVILTLIAVFVYLFVRANGRSYLSTWLTALAIIAVCIEVYWSNPDKKSFVLWRKLFNKTQV